MDNLSLQNNNQNTNTSAIHKQTALNFLPQATANILCHLDQKVIEQIGQKMKLQQQLIGNGNIVRAKVPSINIAGLKKNKFTLPSLILKKKQINFDNDQQNKNYLPDIVSPQIQTTSHRLQYTNLSNRSVQPHPISGGCNGQGGGISNIINGQIQSNLNHQPQNLQQQQQIIKSSTSQRSSHSGGSRNDLMTEELLRKSSMFRRDMRKLNIMKEVKVILENKQRLDIFSPARQRMVLNIPPINIQSDNSLNQNGDNSATLQQLNSQTNGSVGSLSNQGQSPATNQNSSSGFNYRFPYHRRSFCGEETPIINSLKLPPPFPNGTSASQPTSPIRQQNGGTSFGAYKQNSQHFSFKSPRQSFTRLSNNFLSDPNDPYNKNTQQTQQQQLNTSGLSGPQMPHQSFGTYFQMSTTASGSGKVQPFKVNDPQIFQEQFMKIIETTNNTSGIFNDSQNNSLMQKDTAANATLHDGALDPSTSMMMQDTKYYSQLFGAQEDIFEHTFEELLLVQDYDDEEQLLMQDDDDIEEGSGSNNVDGWFLSTLAEAVKKKQSTLDGTQEIQQIEETDLGKVLDACKKDQEREMQQTLNDIIKLIKSKNLIKEKPQTAYGSSLNNNDQHKNPINLQINPQDINPKLSRFAKANHNHHNQILNESNSKDVLNEMKDFFQEMGDSTNSPGGRNNDKKIISRQQVISRSSFGRSQTQQIDGKI